MAKENCFQIFIDHRVGGPHYFAKTLNMGKVSSNYLFAGGKMEPLSKESAYPLLYFNQSSKFQKILQYALNTFLLWFYFVFKIPRKNNVIIHSVKNYPAIFSFLFSFRNNVTLIIHEEQNKFDFVVLRLVIIFRKYRFVRNLNVYSVAASTVHMKFQDEVKLLRYSVPEREKLLLSGAYAAHVRSSDRPIRLLLIGNISPIKNYDRFLLLLCNNNLNIDVFLYGERTGSELYLRKFDTAVNEFEKSGNHFVFMGFSKKEDIWNALPSFDIFCLPSLSEAAPLVLYEMRETGIPILYSDVGDCKEILSNYLNARSVNVNTVSSQSLESILLELLVMNVR